MNNIYNYIATYIHGTNLHKLYISGYNYKDIGDFLGVVGENSTNNKYQVKRYINNLKITLFIFFLGYYFNYFYLYTPAATELLMMAFQMTYEYGRETSIRDIYKKIPLIEKIENRPETLISLWPVDNMGNNEFLRMGL